MVDHRWNELVLDTPLEHPDDATHSLVDLVPAKTGLDHLFAHILQGKRTKFGQPSGAVQAAKRLKGVSDCIVLARWFPILPIVTIRESDVGQDELADRQLADGVPNRFDRGLSPLDHPLAEQADVL